METILHKLLASWGDASRIQKIQPVSGGSINQAYKVQTETRVYFLKTNQGIPQNFFSHEKDGLELLRQTQTISVPKVYGEWYDPEQKKGFLLLEWISGTISKDTEHILGRKLAQLHLNYGTRFGLEADNYLGYLPQSNAWSSDWAAFYRDHRIRPQVELGKQRNRIQGKRLAQCEKLMVRMDHWLNHAPKPSLLHGDLWSGNWIVGSNGEPYLIDPAVSYGDHELDLAFTECFGGFSESFYQGYQEVHPISNTYPERRPLYQLYFLLVHLNIFGEIYGPHVDQILALYQ